MVKAVTMLLGNGFPRSAEEERKARGLMYFSVHVAYLAWCVQEHVRRRSAKDLLNGFCPAYKDGSLLRVTPLEHFLTGKIRRCYR